MYLVAACVLHILARVNGNDRRPVRHIFPPLPIVLFFVLLLYLPCMSIFPCARWVHHITSPFVCTSMKVKVRFHENKVFFYGSNLCFLGILFVSVEGVKFTYMDVFTSIDFLVPTEVNLTSVEVKLLPWKLPWNQLSMCRGEVLYLHGSRFSIYRRCFSSVDAAFTMEENHFHTCWIYFHGSETYSANAEFTSMEVKPLP